MMNTEKTINDITSMSVQFARKLIESVRSNGVKEVNGKKEVTLVGNKFYVWTEPMTRKDGSVINRPHITDCEGNDITEKFKIRQDVYAIVKACDKGKTESKRKKNKSNKELNDIILKDMTNFKNTWVVENNVVTKNIDGVGKVEILGNEYEMNGKKMVKRIVKVNGEVQIEGMNARNIYLRAETIKNKANKKSKEEIEAENDKFFASMLGVNKGVEVISSSVV